MRLAWRSRTAASWFHRLTPAGSVGVSVLCARVSSAQGWRAWKWRPVYLGTHECHGIQNKQLPPEAEVPSG